MPTPAPTSGAVLIAGCSTGIGRVTALRIARRGVAVQFDLTQTMPIPSDHAFTVISSAMRSSAA